MFFLEILSLRSVIILVLNSDFELIDANIFHSQFWFSPHRNGYVTKERLVKYYEIEFYLEDAQSTFINEEKYPIQKNRILIAKPNQIRHSILDFSCLFIYIKPNSVAAKKFLDDLPTILCASNIAKYLSLFYDLIEAHAKQFEGKDLYICSKIYELFYRLQIDAHNSTPNRIVQNIALLENTRKYIRLNYKKTVRLEDMAASAHLSPTYFHKLFKALYGQTPNEYLLEVRLAAAKRMLLTSTVSIEAIALSCGFSSHSYFNAVFKKNTGCTPLQYKNQALDRYFI